MITVIGVDGSPLPPAAAAVIERATLVVGGRRHLAAVPLRPGTAQVALGEVRPALDALAAHDGDAVVLASGDPGFFGIVRALGDHGLKFTVHPGVSSVALAFARAGLAWDDAMVVSAHGRDLTPAVNVCRAFGKVAVLTGPGAGPAQIAAALDGWPRRLVVCEALGAPTERVTECSPDAALTRDWSDPNVVIVIRARSSAETGAGVGCGTGPGWVWPGLVWPRQADLPGGWALAEDAFEHEGAVVTKSEVRALALARLAPAPGSLVWDVGAGAGSVAVECARLGAAVVAVERDAHRCELIRANALRHQVDVRVVAGEAPAALAGLPEPDVVFVGGGGMAVLTGVAERRPPRIVVALAAIERAGQAGATLAEAGYHTDGVMVHAARLAPLPGDVHRLTSTNPVFLLWGSRRYVGGSPSGRREAAS